MTHKSVGTRRRFWLPALIVVGVAALVPALAGAKQLFIWQYDTLDRYYEPETGDSVASSYGLEQALLALGHKVGARSSLPRDLVGYDAMFISLGWSRG
jgi:hypothetical protein